MNDETSDPPDTSASISAASNKALRLIEGARRGDANSVNELISLVYPELKRRARWLMTGERAGHTFGPSGSELVQRVMEKVLSTGGQIFSTASTEESLINLMTRRMRFILVDYARAAGANSRPSPRSRVQFDDIQRSVAVSAVNIEAVLSTDQALTRLAEEDSAAAKALELRFFSGLTNEESAGAMELSVATFRRTLKRAMVFLRAIIEAPVAPQ